MRYKIFGQRTGLKVSEYALGTGLLGKRFGYGTEPEEARGILEAYVGAGGNLIDTSDNYQWGDSEKLIGEFTVANRKDLIIASKYSRSLGPNPSLGALGNHRKAMVQAVEDSLKRLKTDRIDLYFAHLDDSVTPIEEVARGFDDLARAGKIIYAGLSNFPAWRVAIAATIADLRGWVPISAIEVEYSLLQRTTERELLPMADGLGLGVLGYSPLAAGLLTAKYRSGATGRATEFKGSVPHINGNNVLILDELVAVASELGTDPGKVAIAWVSAKRIVPVIGAKTVAQLNDNLAACDISLSNEQIQRLDNVSTVAAGYPHELLAAESQRAAITGNRWSQIDFPKGTVA